MSDSKSSYGEPVEEPTPVDGDVVGRAHAGLADAEAARAEHGSAESADARAAHGEPVVSDPATVEPPAAHEPVTHEPVTHEPAAHEPVTHEPAAHAPAAYEPVTHEPAATRSFAEPAYVAPPADEEVPEYVPGMYSNRTTGETTAAHNDAVADQTVAVAPVVAAAPQPIFVQAPEAPRPRGTRGAAGAIGLLAALAFAVLYLAAWLGFGAIAGKVTVDNVGSTALAALGTWSLWVTVVVFFLAFWLLGGIINRGRWGVWVNVGLLVGVASYGGHILGQLFQAPFWGLTASQGRALVDGQLLAPLAIAAFIIGRELTIWFGAWVAARGARVTERNAEAQREYERTLEAGPQLVRQ